MSLKELLEEAEEDEMKGVKWKHSRLKSKLVEYRHHMFQNYAAGTVRKEMNCIIFFYKFYDIKVWDLPKVNDKSILSQKNDLKTSILKASEYTYESIKNGKYGTLIAKL